METTQKSIDAYLPIVRESRAAKTYLTYLSALRSFTLVVGPDAPLIVDTYIKFLRKTRDLSPSTQAIYRSAIHGVYLQCAPETWAGLKSADARYALRGGSREVVEFDRAAIERIIVAADQDRSGLQALRDRAFILTLADSGLRISEACALQRGRVDFQEGRAVIVGKRGKKAAVRFSNRSLAAIQSYLSARAELDGGSGKPLASLPLFARHDKGAGRKVKPVGSHGMWAAVKHIARSVNAAHVRVHDFRHYFVTMFYLGSGDEAATQEAARHSSRNTTARYTHLGGKVDKLYNEIFNHTLH